MSEEQSAAPAVDGADLVQNQTQDTQEQTSIERAAAEVGLTPQEESLEQELESAEEQGDEQKAEELQKKIWKLQVNGEEIEIDNEDELLKRAQMGFSADQKWQEAAKVQKQMEAMAELLQSDPIEALRRLGHNVDDMAENHMKGRIAEMQKSPEQVAQEQLQKELVDIKKQKEALESDRRDTELSKLKNDYATQIESDITVALDEAQDLPKSPYVLKRMADALIMAAQSGRADLTPKQVLPFVADQIKKEIQQMFTVMPEELIESVIGKDVLTKMRKRRLKRAKAAPKSTTKNIKQTAAGAEGKVEVKPKNKVSAKDFFKNLGSL